ncbi:3-deoxy-D-manno-octulosonic acid kinase [hydrothermal vent metagenome]|uniref:non-specific serine/threonine protein kinase n=1 Tax=hydrothermal vent metagenome TaxID=652676 RepID=A0A3B0WMQ7_9ZZZZ
MSSDKNYKIAKTGNAYILYDADIITEPTVQLFNRDYHTKSQVQQSGKQLGEQSGGIGRAKVVYFSQGEKLFVLKHYYRGGVIASIIKDHYFGFRIVKSRAFREFRLLKKMHELGLSVPVAVAAQVEKGLLFYQADLITEEIKNAKTLSDVLSNNVLNDDNWQKIGRCIKQFHQKNIYHADLNARNILLTEDLKIYLIDFDNSYIRLGSSAWKMANLSRLKRSLLKFKNKTANFYFTEDCWSSLLLGYNSFVEE